MLGDKILKVLGIPSSALFSIIFGMMLLSFPIGAYIVFNTNIGNDIDYRYPLQDTDFIPLFDTIIPIYVEIGDIFIILWSIYAVIFAIAICGPQKNFFKEIIRIMNEGKYTCANYMITVLKWFVVLVLISTAINIIQESIGITIEQPPSTNNLIQFFNITQAPLIEEIGFRVILIGIPLYLIYTHKISARHFFKSLWHPYEHLDISEKNKAIILIILVAVFFGIAHIISEESWSSGKFTQATAGGIIIGWVYFRFGLAPALLIHWATNYFIFSYVYLIAEIGDITIREAFSYSMIQTFEIIFIITGMVTAAIMSIHYIINKEKLKV